MDQTQGAGGTSMQQQDAGEQLWRILAKLNYDGQQSCVTQASFSSPNFELVCDILHWLATLVDRISIGRVQKPSREDLTLTNTPKGHELVGNDNNNNGTRRAIRLRYLNQVASLIKCQLGICVDQAALYRADATSWPELLKIALIVEQAALKFLASKGSRSELTNQVELAKQQRATTIGEIIKLLQLPTRHNSTDVQLLQQNPETVSTRYANDTKLELEWRKFKLKLERYLLSAGLDSPDLSAKLELDASRNQKRRLDVIERKLEWSTIETLLRQTAELLSRQVKLEILPANESLRKDLIELDAKLQRKQAELSELEMKLSDAYLELQMQRLAPDQLDKQEQLYKQYESVYASYVTNWRNFSYLDQCISQSCLVSRDQTGVADGLSSDSFEDNDDFEYARENLTADTLLLAAATSDAGFRNNRTSGGATATILHANNRAATSRSLRVAAATAASQRPNGFELEDLLSEFVTPASDQVATVAGDVRESESGDDDASMSEDDNHDDDDDRGYSGSDQA